MGISCYAANAAHRGVPVLKVGHNVQARNYGGGKWKNGSVTEVLGTRHYMVQLQDGQSWKRHVDQLFTRTEDPDILSCSEPLVKDSTLDNEKSMV